MGVTEGEHICIKYKLDVKYKYNVSRVLLKLQVLYISWMNTVIFRRKIEKNKGEKLESTFLTEMVARNEMMDVCQNIMLLFHPLFKTPASWIIHVYFFFHLHKNTIGSGLFSETLRSRFRA